MPLKPRTHRPISLPANPRDRRATACQRGYDHRWREARGQYLLEHPLCVQCEAEGRTVVATVVDHKQPHRGDPGLFWDQENWQSLCTYHHNRKTGKGE